MTTPAQIQAWATAGGSLYPGAVWKPLPENATQPRISPRAFILHTQAGSGPATNLQVWTYSARPDVVNEAQFYLQMDGQLMQAISLFVRADSSLKANPWAITVETQDLGGATVDKTPWTNEQLQVLAEIAAFLHLHPQIRLPLQPVPTWDGAGVAPHNRFSQWSATAHSCPGKARTLQVPEVIARAQAIAAWRPPTEVIPPPTFTKESEMLIADSKTKGGACVVAHPRDNGTMGYRMYGFGDGVHDGQHDRSVILAMGTPTITLDDASYLSWADQADPK